MNAWGIPRRDRDDHRVVDDRERRLLARVAVRGERPRERALEREEVVVRVVIARHERHLPRGEGALLEGLGERFELRRRAVFGEVPSEDDVIGAGGACPREGVTSACPPASRVDRPSEAEVAQAQCEEAGSRPVPFLDEVQVRELCDAGHG